MCMFLGWLPDVFCFCLPSEISIFDIQIIFYGFSHSHQPIRSHVRKSLLTWIDLTWILLNMRTLSNENIFCVTGPLCGEFTGHRWIPRTKASDAELCCFLWSVPENKRLNKQSWGWWFETPLRSLWRNCNVIQAPVGNERMDEVASDLKLV